MDSAYARDLKGISMGNFIDYRQDGPVITLTMNEPERRNPLTGNSKCPTTGAATGYNCTDFANPDPRDPWAATHSVYRSDKALDVEQRTRTTSAYVFDTIELNEQWMINLGLRL